MSNASNYARLINFLHVSRGSEIEEGCEEVLTFILARQESGVPTKVTDLMYAMIFGTAQTVHRKVKQLHDAGLIKFFKVSTDARIKLVEISPKGMKYLESQHKKLHAAMNPR